MSIIIIIGDSGVSFRMMKDVIMVAVIMAEAVMMMI